MTIPYHYDAATNSLLVQAPDPLALRECLPKSRVIDHAVYNIALQYTLPAARVLRNMDVIVPSPIQLRYHWPGKYTPWSHQRQMAGAMTMHRRIFNLSDMGTGKSAATLWAADHLLATQQIRRVLILAPLATLERVWMHDIFDLLMHRTVALVHGSQAHRMRVLATPADFYVLNHDGLGVRGVAEAIRTNPDIDLVVIDEFSKFRNHATRRYKILSRTIRPDMRVWGLTATPCPNAPTDAWALARLMHPATVPPFGTFKRQTMQQVSTFKWAPRMDGYTHAFDILQPAVRFEKSQCLDLPPVTYIERQAAITDEQRDAYNQMRARMHMDAASTQITAVNAADKLNKLRQVLCGVVKDPTTGDYITIPHGPRAAVLLDVIAQAKAKVIVVIPFKGIVYELEKTVRAAGYSVAIMNGDVSVPHRNRILKAFQEDVEPRVILCHPEVMSHGLNLTAADVTVFYAPIYSNDQFQQVMERMNRAGQVNKMTVVKIGALPLEWAIYRQLHGSQEQQMNTLDLFRQFVTLDAPPTLPSTRIP